MDGLVEYVQAYNKEHPFRLHIWTATPRAAEQRLSDEAIIRFTIRDVLTIFLTVGCTPSDPTLVVEGATAFGPREKVRAGGLSGLAAANGAGVLTLGLETAARAVGLRRVPAALAIPGQDAAGAPAGAAAAVHGQCTHHSAALPPREAASSGGSLLIGCWG